MPARAFVWGTSGAKLAAPAQTGRCVAQPGMQRDQQLQKEGKLPFQLQRVHVSPTGGLSGSPPPTPGSNKTPGVLRHGHSSCLGRPIPSKATPKINGKRFIRGLGGELLTTSGSPFADLSFLSAQAASTENIPRSGRQYVGDPVSEQHQRAEAGHHRPYCSLVHSLILLFIQVAGLCFIHAADIKHLLGIV